MSILPISLQRLPKVSRSSAVAGRALEAWLFELGEPVAIDLGGVGPIRVSVDGVDSALTLPTREEFSVIGKDGRRGRIAVDLWLALTLVSGALGASPPSILRGLGVGERGVLAGQIAAVVGYLGRHWGTFASVDVGGEGRVTPGPVASVRLLVEGRAGSGRVRLDLPAGWLTSLPRMQRRLQTGLRAHGSRLRTIGRMELALTRVAAPEWASARPGDAVVFDGVAPVGTAGDWAIELRIGEHAAAARLDAGGTLSIEEPFRPVAARATGAAIRSRNEFASKEPATMSSRSDDDTDQTILALAGAPIEVVAEVGRLSLRGDEVLRLQPGSVLPLGTRTLDVQLMAGGEPWARGELVDIDGELAVRITALSRPALPG